MNPEFRLPSDQIVILKLLQETTIWPEIYSQAVRLWQTPMTEEELANTEKSFLDGLYAALARSYLAVLSRKQPERFGTIFEEREGLFEMLKMYRRHTDIETIQGEPFGRFRVADAPSSEYYPDAVGSLSDKLQLYHFVPYPSLDALWAGLNQLKKFNRHGRVKRQPLTNKLDLFFVTPKTGIAIPDAMPPLVKKLELPFTDANFAQFFSYLLISYQEDQTAPLSTLQADACR